MINYGKVKSTERPEAIVVDEYSVWLHKDITEISENVGTESEFTGFEFTMIKYDKNEYIRIQTETNTALQQQITDTELALCEVYEMLS